MKKTYCSYFHPNHDVYCVISCFSPSQRLLDDEARVKSQGQSSAHDTMGESLRKAISEVEAQAHLSKMTVPASPHGEVYFVFVLSFGFISVSAFNENVRDFRDINTFS